jgi:hypothetical protein
VRLTIPGRELELDAAIFRIQLNLLYVFLAIFLWKVFVVRKFSFKESAVLYIVFVQKSSRTYII